MKNKYWFNKVTSRLTLSKDELEKILEYAYDMLKRSPCETLVLSDGVMSDLKPRIVFITLSDEHSSAKRFMGSGDGIVDALNEGIDLAQKSPLKTFNSLKVDVVLNVVPLLSHKIKDPLKFDPSLYGFSFNEEINLSYLPEEIVSYSLVGSDGIINLNKIQKSIRSEDPAVKSFEGSEVFDMFVFENGSGFKSESESVVLYRGHRIYSEITKKELLSAAIAAGKYLCAAVNEDGSFIYEYLPKRDIVPSRYNVLRHAGTVYSILELYEHTQDKKLLNAANRALKNLLSRAKPISLYKSDLLCIVEKDYVKLGANALALLAISKYIKITKDESYMGQARKLALWIKETQAPSGEFLSHKIQFSELKKTPFVSNYYPGEAIFALARFYQLDKNPLWFEMAEKAANFIINVRDENKSIQEIEHDHWLLYGLNELYQLRPHQQYVTHTVKLCEAIKRSQYIKSEPRDYFGSFYAIPRSTPTAIRAEGLSAAYHLLKEAKLESEAQKVLEVIENCIRFQLQTQFTPERTLYLPNPQYPMGGFSKSLTDFGVRIDYVQHNISSLLGLYKILVNR